MIPSTPEQSQRNPILRFRAGTHHTGLFGLWLGVALAILGKGEIIGQEVLGFESIIRDSGGDVTLRLHTPSDTDFYRIDVSEDLKQWESWLTSPSEEMEHADPAGAERASRYYRARELDESPPLTGDHLTTSQGDAIIHPVNHASFVIHWNGVTLYNDPVGGTNPYRDLPPADIILVGHTHGDHFDAGTLTGLRQADTRIVVSQEVYNRMSTTLRNASTILNNGQSAEEHGVGIEAVPAYNSRHPQGDGNGYVITLGDKRIYMSGDTGDIQEMRDLTDIDVAFVSMNLPFTMSVNQAASAIREFQPAVVYPYHYRNQDGTFANLDQLKRLAGGVEVRKRDWY